ncbi:MAG: glycine cleavage system aminomethyltransferase GcvT [Candidatus Kryptoniota bacterium]
MNKTPFNEIHKQLGAKMVEFAGFEMPVQYSSIVEEHKRVRESVGVFDVSHMGEFFVSGRDSELFLQKTTINDVTKLYYGRAQYSALINDEGNLLDDLIVYKMQDKYMVVVNAANIEKDFRIFSSRIIGDVKIDNASDRIGLLSVQGPKSVETLQKLTKTDLSAIRYYHFAEGKIAGIDSIISRTGYTGELGFEIFFEVRQDNYRALWKSIFEAGAEFGIIPVGLGARDTLRLEMGYCLYGNDIDETTNPLEAGLSWITKLDKGDFIGKDALLRARQNITRKLIGFKLIENGIPRHGYEIFSGDRKVGFVTSGTFSPILQQGIGMGYVQKEFSNEGTEIKIDIRGKRVSAKVVNPPFVPKKN